MLDLRPHPSHSTVRVPKFPNCLGRRLTGLNLFAFDLRQCPFARELPTLFGLMLQGKAVHECLTTHAPAATALSNPPVIGPPMQTKNDPTLWNVARPHRRHQEHHMQNVARICCAIQTVLPANPTVTQTHELCLHFASWPSQPTSRHGAKHILCQDLWRPILNCRKAYTSL